MQKSFGKNKIRKNEEIRLPEIFLINENGDKIGKISTSRAREMAQKVGLDLVEIAPTQRPPVCKILDFGNFVFEQKKKVKEQKKNSKKAEIKGVRFGIRISDHDFDVKIRAAEKFLKKGHPIKVTLIFRGREIVHSDLGFEKVIKFAESLAEISKIDQNPKKMGRQIIMILIPKRKK